MSRKRKRSAAQSVGAIKTSVVAAVPQRSQMALSLAEDEGRSRLEVALHRDPRPHPKDIDDAAGENLASAFEPAAVEHQRKDPSAAQRGSSTTTGERLRRAREQRGQTLGDLARELKIGVAILSDIEADRIDATTPGVYARSYLKAYARALDLPELAVSSALLQNSLEPELIAVQRAPRSMFGSQNANRLLYAVLTVLIGGPVLWGAWEASRRPLETPPLLAALDVRSSDLPVAATLDPAPATTPVAASASGPGNAVASILKPLDTTAPGPGTPGVTASPEPLAASAVLTPDRPRSVPARADGVSGDLDESTQHAVTASLTPVTHGGSASRRIVLHLAQASWVEIRGSDGQRIEYALLMAGSTRQYQISGHAEVRIGNARAAQVELDGQSLDLAPYTRSNVAHLTVDDSPPN